MKLVNRAVLFLFVSMLFLLILKAQEPDTKIYTIESEGVSKQTLPLDIPFSHVSASRLFSTIKITQVYGSQNK